MDDSRVFATGFSDGGFMDFQLGCNLANRIAAIAPVGAAMAKSQEEFCKNWTFRPVALLMINGTEDPVLPYKGTLDCSRNNFRAGYRKRLGENRRAVPRARREPRCRRALQAVWKRMWIRTAIARRARKFCSTVLWTADISGRAASSLTFRQTKLEGLATIWKRTK